MGLFDAIFSKSADELHQIGQGLIQNIKDKASSAGDFLSHQQVNPNDAPIPMGPFNIKPFAIGEDINQGVNGGSGRDTAPMVPSDPTGYQLLDGQDKNPFDFLATMKAGNPLFSLYSKPIYMGTNDPKMQQEQVTYGMSVGPWRHDLGQYTRNFVPPQNPHLNYPAPQWTPPANTPPPVPQNPNGVY